LDLHYLFRGCEKLTRIPHFFTGNVTSMRGMFANCRSLETIPELNTEKVTDFRIMFEHCSSLVYLPALRAQPGAEVYGMFSGCHRLEKSRLAEANPREYLDFLLSSQRNPHSIKDRQNLDAIDRVFSRLYSNYEEMRLRLKENAEEKLERERQNRELITNITHDLKTPITSIKGYVEGLIDGVANTPEKRERYLRTIYSKANDMNTLINELTLYSQIDNNKIPYNFHKINVADYFGDCVEELGMDMESRGITLNYSNLVSPDTTIVADPEQLKKVINNIVGNSVKYMDKAEGKIDIRILDEHDSVRIEIEDNGMGIPAKDLPNIFDRFYRTDESRSSAQGGSGIGLSIVRKVIEDHGGYVWATSREGEGTCVHFVIRKYHETDDMDDYVEEI
jgi:signal transduction histidine kinase